VKKAGREDVDVVVPETRGNDEATTIDNRRLRSDFDGRSQAYGNNVAVVYHD